MWISLTAFLYSQPHKGNAEQSLFVYSLAYLAPVVLILFLALIRMRRAATTALGPGVAALVTGAWLIASLMLFSEPAVTDSAPLDWLAFTFGLIAVWCGIGVPAALQAWTLLRRAGARRIAAYLLPLPLAVTSCITLVSLEAPEEVRLNLSEPELTNHVADFQSTMLSAESKLVGLLKVERTYQSGDCVMLRLGTDAGFLGGPSNEHGLAYCPSGNPPEIVAWYFRHEYGYWWTYETQFS